MNVSLVCQRRKAKECPRNPKAKQDVILFILYVGEEFVLFVSESSSRGEGRD